MQNNYVRKLIGEQDLLELFNENTNIFSKKKRYFEEDEIEDEEMEDEEENEPMSSDDLDLEAMNDEEKLELVLEILKSCECDTEDAVSEIKKLISKDEEEEDEEDEEE